MSNRLTILAALVLFLMNISTSLADEIKVHIFWQGDLTISGFSLLPGGPQNTDANPSTMTFQWAFIPGSFHRIKQHVCANPRVTGAVVLHDSLGPGKDMNLNIGSILKVTELLPPGTVTFPPGVTPPFQSTGSPISEIVMQDADLNLDTVLNVIQVDFDGNIMTFKVQEGAQPGTMAASTLFHLEDVGGNRDGILSRPFTVALILEDFDGCTIPALIPAMGEKSLLILASMMFFFGAGFLYRYGDFKAQG